MDTPSRIALARMATFIIDNGNSCTGWSGCTTPDGYPMFWYEGHTRHASRILWEIVFGTIPEGQVIRHKCDNPACLQLSHLELGTVQQNQQDSISRGRRPKTRGKYRTRRTRK